VRYLAGSCIPLYLLVAKGIKNITESFARSLAVIVLVLSSLFNVAQYYKEFHKERWREVASYLDDKADKGEIILFSPSYIAIPFEYYSKREDLEKFSIDILNDSNSGAEKEKLNRLLEGVDKVWVVLWNSKYFSGKNKDLLKRLYGLSFVKEYSWSVKYRPAVNACLFKKVIPPSLDATVTVRR
jgi:hypothetical protein